MYPSVTIIIPAWNEVEIIAETLNALREMNKAKYMMNNVCGKSGYPLWDELIVVDDGSTDGTYEEALPYADCIVRHKTNLGKGSALTSGWKIASGDILLFLDADLGSSVVHSSLLLEPLLMNQADMTIAKFPAATTKGGFGLVKGLAVQGIYQLSGYKTAAPLSGQRAVRKQVLERIGGLTDGFGIEVGLTIDVARAGYRISEIAVPLQHRETGRDWQGFFHRGKQFISVGRTLMHRWLNPLC